MYNNCVIDELKTKNSKDEELRKALYDDIINFKLIEIKELTNASTKFNVKTFDKSNIDVDFDKNLSSSEEGKVSTIKVLTRENKNSHWLVAGQEGHGL